MYSTIIQAQVLNQYLYDPAWAIFDCRYDLMNKPQGYRDYLHSHVPGAVYADLHDDLSGPPVTDHGRHPLPTPDRLCQVFSSFGIGKESQVVVYDSSSGSIAARLWWLLRYMGHEAVAVLDGGWQSWQTSGYATESGERKNQPAVFTGEPNKGWLVTMKAVRSLPLLVDSREPGRYRGELEPIDPVAGHIPGAVNHYWQENLDEVGYFLAPQQLRQKLALLYGDIPEQEVTFYCGSGVTACHNLLAAAHAGFSIPRLYAGSWSEWCSVSGQPVAKGA